MKDFRILLSVAFAMACLGLQAEQLSGSMSNRENAFYALGADAQLELEARDFAPNATVKATLTIHDEFEKELERRGLKFTTDASGAWKGSVPLPTARYGFYRVRVATESGTTLPKVGSRPKGCVTYAVCHAEKERRKLSQEDSFFGLFGGAPHLAEWLGFHHRYGWQTPTADAKKGAENLARRRADAAAGFLRAGVRDAGTAGGQRGRMGRADAGRGMRDRDGRADADGGDAGGRAAFGADISEGSGDPENGNCRVAAGDLCAIQVEWS